MTIKHLGGIFGRNPELNNVEVQGNLDVDTNLRIGTSSLSPGYGNTESGAALRTGGLNFFSRSGSIPVFVNRSTTEGSTIMLRYNGNEAGNIGSYGNDLYIGTGDTNLKFNNADDAILPITGSGSSSDGNTDLGSSSARFQDIYATNGTIQTSDQNEKQDIRALTQAEYQVAVSAKSLIRAFKWKSDVQEKGGNAEIHFGVIAQDLEQAFSNHGLNAEDYGVLIRDQWEDESGEQRTRLGVRYSELLAFIISAI